MQGELEEKLFDDNAEDIAKEHFDFILVGSGMGGGTVARKLIEQDKKVLVLERGGLLWTTHVLNFATTFEGPKKSITRELERTNTRQRLLT